MATYTSSAWTNRKEQYLPRAGELAVAHGVVAVTSNLGNSDILQFLRLPQRALVIGGRLQGAALAAAATYAIGISTDTDKYGSLAAVTGAAVTNVHGAGTLAFIGGTNITGGSETGVYAALTAEEEVYATVSSVTTGTTGSIGLVMEYTTDIE